MLKKYNPNGEIEFSPLYFNPTTKTVINHKFNLENAYEEILQWIDPWINEGSGWIVELKLTVSTLTFQLLDHYQGVLT